MKIKLSIMLMLTFVSSVVKAEQVCEKNEALLGAHYQLINSQVNIIDDKPFRKDIVIKSSALWRQNQKVLFVDGEKSTTWFNLNNGLVQRTAHFDHFKRSIEYQAKPMSVVHWQQISQMIPNIEIKSLNFSGSQLKGCYHQETYQWENKATSLQGKLVWNADLKLVTELTIRQGDRQSHWQLERVEQNKNIIEAEFEQRSAYQATDFADIGDNESDPFLIKMINLGFVEHSSSGIYNTQGENMAIQHNH